MKPIDTRYAGRLFRSRLEARWAVFFEALGVAFQYEPEGFQFDTAPDPTFYLPDFWLPRFGVWVEIKGAHPTVREREKCGLLAAGSGRRVYLMSGQFPDVFCSMFYGSDTPDGFDCVGLLSLHDGDAWGGLGWDEDDVAVAMEAATSARFEFGDRGAHGFSRPADIIAESTAGLLGSVRRAREIEEQKAPILEGDERA